MSLRVAELFAGVGGFRIGLEGPPGAPRNGAFKVVFSNQWEPSTKTQHAAEVYARRWGLTPDPERPTRFINPGIEDEEFVNVITSAIMLERSYWSKYMPVGEA